MLAAFRNFSTARLNSKFQIYELRYPLLHPKRVATLSCVIENRKTENPRKSASSSVTLPACGPVDRRARGRSGGRHCTAALRRLLLYMLILWPWLGSSMRQCTSVLGMTSFFHIMEACLSTNNLLYAQTAGSSLLIPIALLRFWISDCSLNSNLCPGHKSV